MRAILLLCLVVATACRPIYGRDVANFTAFPEKLPAIGTPLSELEVWFDKLGYAPGPDVFQAEGELRNPPNGPQLYLLDEDRSWWRSRVRTVQDYCVTQKFIYYKLDDAETLRRAIQNKRSVC